MRKTSRVISGTSVAEFRDAVRARDKRCVVTGYPVVDDDWTAFEAAHIFPLAHLDYWKQHNFSRCIKFQPNKESSGTINSVQNGKLLDSSMHVLFDNYKFSINPDVQYVYHMSMNFID